MRKYVLTAAFVVTSGAAFADYYVVQDTTSHRCSIVEQTPAGKNMVVVPGTKTYSSRDQAEAALKRADACNNATAERPAPRGQVRFLSSAPAGATSVTRLYKQNVYDANNAKIGEIDDILLTN